MGPMTPILIGSDAKAVKLMVITRQNGSKMPLKRLGFFMISALLNKKMVGVYCG
jgi:hypothetical protein